VGNSRNIIYYYSIFAFGKYCWDNNNSNNINEFNNTIENSQTQTNFNNTNNSNASSSGSLNSGNNGGTQIPNPPTINQGNNSAREIANKQAQINANNLKISSLNNEITNLTKVKNDCLEAMSQINANYRIQAMNATSQAMNQGMSSGYIQQLERSYENMRNNALKPFQDLLKDIEKDIETRNKLIIEYNIANNNIYNFN